MQAAKIATHAATCVGFKEADESWTAKSNLTKVLKRCVSSCVSVKFLILPKSILQPRLEHCSNPKAKRSTGGV